MTNKTMDFSSFVGKLLARRDTDVLREGVRVLPQALMDAEVSTQIGRSSTSERTFASPKSNGYRKGSGTPGLER